MWYMLADKDRYVYHYTRVEKLVQYILPSGMLRFSRYENLNDPFEAKDWALGFHRIVMNVFGNTKQIEAAVNRIIKRNCRIGCFSSDCDGALVTREREDKGENILNAIYERGHSRPRMWAQYADDHKGVCMVFEKAKLHERINRAASSIGVGVTAGPVTYRNPQMVPNLKVPDPFILSTDRIGQIGLDQAVQEHIGRHLQELFFLKSNDWKQEREYRWVIHGNDDQDFHVDFGDAFVGLALGFRFPDPYKMTVGQFCHENSVNVVEMKWQNGVPQPSPLAARVLANGGYSAAS